MERGGRGEGKGDRGRETEKKHCKIKGGRGTCIQVLLHVNDMHVDGRMDRRTD